MSISTKKIECQQADQRALELASHNLAKVPDVCMKHLHNWRKRYFNSIGIFKTSGIDWSKEYDGTHG